MTGLLQSYTSLPMLAQKTENALRSGAGHHHGEVLRHSRVAQSRSIRGDHLVDQDDRSVWYGIRSLCPTAHQRCDSRDKFYFRGYICRQRKSLNTWHRRHYRVDHSPDHLAACANHRVVHHPQRRYPCCAQLQSRMIFHGKYHLENPCRCIGPGHPFKPPKCAQEC